MNNYQYVYDRIPDLSELFPEHTFIHMNDEDYLVIGDWGVSCESLLKADYPLDIINGAVGAS